MALKRKSPPRTESPIPVRTEETQQLEKLLYLTANLLDARLERGFTGGIMLARGGEHSDYLVNQGRVLSQGDVTEQRFADALVDYTKQEKGRTEVIQKMRKLFSKLEQGKPTQRTDRYFSFVSAEKAEEAAKLLRESGFGVKHKEGARGIEITALPEEIEKSISEMRSGLVEEAKNAFLSRENAELAARNREREAVTNELLAGLDIKSAPLPKRRDPDDAEYQALREVRGMHPIEAANMILKTIIAPMISNAERAAVWYLLERGDVVEELRKLPQPEALTSKGFSFENFTEEEYKKFIAFLRGEMGGEVALKSTGGEPAWLRKYHAARGGSREAFEPWEALSFDDVENLTKIDRGWEATLIRNTDESAAQTIAALEQRFPDRAITRERTPDEAGKGGHWAITVLAEGERASSIEQWMESTLPTLSKDDSFYRIAARAISGKRERVSFTQETMPRWMAYAIDRSRSSEEKIVFREDFRRALASRGVDVPESITGTVLYGRKKDREKPRYRGEKPTAINYSFELSGQRFNRRLELARADEAKTAEAERKAELAEAQREREREGRG